MLLRQFESIEKTENGYIIHGDAADVMLVFMTSDLIRIRVSFDRKFPERSYTLVTTAWEDAMDELLSGERKRITALDVPCEEKEKELVFKTETLELHLLKKPFSFRLYTRDGKLIYSDLAERAFEKDQLGRLYHYNKMDRDKDHFYGFGEKTGYLDKKGRRLRMSPKDAIGHDPEKGDPMYKHIPFYIRVNENDLHALGLFYHNSYDCLFDMGEEISGYWDRYSYYQTDGGDIDLFLMNGPDMGKVLDLYTRLTGRMAMPTKQSLGYCASTMYYAELEKDCDQEIYKVIDKHEKEDIPIDNFWLASGYSSGEEDNLRYVFNWNRRRFPQPEKFFEEMNRRGINVIPNLKPGILKHHPYIEYFEKENAFIKTPDGKADYYGRWWGGEGRFIDFTSVQGRNAWKKLLEENILKKGTKTVWNDNCEMDGVEDRDAYCDREGLGGTMAELKILHSNLMAFLGKQAIKDVYPGERPYIINRAGYAGIQRYAQVWGGDNLTDWRTLKFNVATIMGMGLSGCANMGCDIGGFAGPAPESELLLRWIQNGIFQPRFTINSANNDNTVTQPWMYEENIPYVREAYHLRYRMFPYLYSLMAEAHETGMPVMRPLFLEFPEDKRCYTDESLSFMYGSSILVANVLEKGAVTRKLYLPKGSTWYDMNDKLKAYEGGQEIEIPVDASSIPMFLRGNGIFTTTEDVKHILRDTMKHLDVFVGGEADAAFTLYDDDGHTEDFEKGIFAKTEITVKAGDRTKIRFRKEGEYPSTLETMMIKLVSKEKGAYWATLDGEQIPRFIIRDAYDAAESGWYYNMSDRTIWVKFPVPKKDDFEVVISKEKFDLIGMTEDE
ncbi:alpha-glucosidase [Oribacterium sp. C9]|uniref:glycoside hydrolase family 31 protein n=1 Tax=Oribacterium sp. C9 TaxID=1943579 RepID=UPI00098F4C50|nr:TIM-barrel domain-containing protein [Oribacterium sp. C9]OON85243.1 alpha-glucosidase [Oribacterium sp. C9]